MSDESTKNKSFFAVFVNLLGVISAVLYFAGWMYRLAYYRRFELNIMELEFSFESFLLIPVASIFSGLLQIILFTNPFMLILYVALGLISIFAAFVITKKLVSLIKKFALKIFQNTPVIEEAKSFYELLDKFYVFETLAISFVLFVLFSLCWIKGFKDGSRDIYEGSSLLPKVKIESLGNIPLNRNKDWRLLLRQNDWIYLVSTSKDDSTESPQVVALGKGESGDKSIILEPKN